MPVQQAKILLPAEIDEKVPPMIKILREIGGFTNYNISVFLVKSNELLAHDRFLQQENEGN